MTKSNFKNMRWVIIGLCFLANAINYIDRANLAIAAPHIRAELALDPATMGVIMNRCRRHVDPDGSTGNVRR
ncbi:MAG: hypothetical protein U0N28_10710 [Megasphaera massiliensis]|uniref:hypothetical protein n=1 Tax=Megasphaera massiliensis TaxID=1232428 RepID=UPI002F94235A